MLLLYHFIGLMHFESTNYYFWIIILTDIIFYIVLCILFFYSRCAFLLIIVNVYKNKTLQSFIGKIKLHYNNTIKKEKCFRETIFLLSGFIQFFMLSTMEYIKAFLDSPALNISKTFLHRSKFYAYPRITKLLCIFMTIIYCITIHYNLHIPLFHPNAPNPIVH